MPENKKMFTKNHYFFKFQNQFISFNIQKNVRKNLIDIQIKESFLLILRIVQNYNFNDEMLILVFEFTSKQTNLLNFTVSFFRNEIFFL